MNVSEAEYGIEYVISEDEENILCPVYGFACQRITNRGMLHP